MFFTRTFCVRGKATTRSCAWQSQAGHPLQALGLAKRRCTVVALLQHLAKFGATTVAVGHPVDGL